MSVYHAAQARQSREQTRGNSARRAAEPQPSLPYPTLPTPCVVAEWERGKAFFTRNTDARQIAKSMRGKDNQRFLDFEWLMFFFLLLLRDFVISVNFSKLSNYKNTFSCFFFLSKFIYDFIVLLFIPYII